MVIFHTPNDSRVVNAKFGINLRKLLWILLRTDIFTDFGQPVPFFTKQPSFENTSKKNSPRYQVCGIFGRTGIFTFE